MSIRTKRVAIFATVLSLFVLVIGAGDSGAFAQQTEETVSSADAETAPAATDTAPRFYAQEVIQPLPAAEDGAGEDDSADADSDYAADSLHALVAALPTAEMSADMKCLAEAIYFEARGEPLSGQLAVGRVVVNRAQDPAFPDDYCGVVKQPSQFSFVKKGRIPTPKTSSLAWRQAQALARIAHEELWVSEVDDALFFHATYVNPRWARAKVATARIDSHIFYR